MGENDDTITLYVIPYSHFCLMAKWALTVANKPVKEVSYLPGFHMLLGPFKRLRTAASPAATTERITSTPLGVDGKGNVLVNSSWDGLKMVGKIDPSLQTLLNDVVGPHTRSIVMDHMTRQTPESDANALGLFTKYSTSMFQRGLISIRFIRKSMCAKFRSLMVRDDAYMDKCRKELAEAFEKIEVMIQEDKSGQFALDTPTPSASVIAVASLCYPVLVEDMRDTSLAFTFYSKDLQEEIMKWRDTGLGKWCLKAYKAYPNKYS